MRTSAHKTNFLFEVFQARFGHRKRSGKRFGEKKLEKACSALLRYLAKTSSLERNDLIPKSGRESAIGLPERI